jgi:hypothetical protein
MLFMKDFCELKVWQKTHALTLAVYRITARFPREELYGLTGQIWRSCSSIPANLAEGCGRKGMPSLHVFVHLPLVRQANWNIICCSPETSS